MTLLEILVKELPKRGGWPVDSDDERTLSISLPQAMWGLNSGGYYAFVGPGESVNREQYEAALSAPKATEWNGEGFPPVGCECEMAWSESGFEPCKILFIGESVALVKRDRREDCYTLSTVKFRPLRSEADRKRDEANKSIAESLFNDGDMSTAEALRLATFVYDAIAAGKIPGIRIE